MAKSKMKRKRAPKSVLKLRSGTVEKCRSEEPKFAKFSADLRSCDQRIHRVVLLGTKASLQQDRSHPVSDLTRTAALCIYHHQFAARGSAKTGVDAADCGLLSADLAAVDA
jgi:hypothetical protein